MRSATHPIDTPDTVGAPVHGRPQTGHTIGHGCGVVGSKDTVKDTVPRGQASNHEGTVGDALGPWWPYGGPQWMPNGRHGTHRHPRGCNRVGATAHDSADTTGW